MDSILNKRGISQLVVTVILILLVLVAIGIIAAVFFGIIQESSSGVDSSKFTVSLSLLPAPQVVNNSDNTQNVILKVKRNTGKGELIGMQFVLSNDTSSTTKRVDISLDELEEQTLSIPTEGIPENSLKSVAIFPIMKTLKGEIAYANLGQVYYFQTKKIESISSGGAVISSSDGKSGLPSPGGGSSGGDGGGTACDLTFASWGTTFATEGASINLNVQGSNCQNQNLNYTIYEVEPLFNDNIAVTSFISDSLNPSWAAIWMEDGAFQGDPEYSFIVYTVNNPSEILTSSNQLSVSKPVALVCGNNICQAGETCLSCLQDCGICPIVTANFIIENVTGNKNTHRIFIQPSPYVLVDVANNDTVFLSHQDLALFPQPNPGQSFYDLDTGYKITRITNVSITGFPNYPKGYDGHYFEGLHNGYAKWGNVNYNNKYVLAFGSTAISLVYNLTDYTFIRPVQTKSGFPKGEPNGVRWDQRGTPGTENLLYYYDGSKLLRQDVSIGSSSEVIIHDFQPYSSVSGDVLNTNSDGDASSDGKYFAVTLKFARKTIVYDLFNDKVLPGMPYNGDNSDVDISPDGKWLQITGLANWSGFYRVENLSRGEINFIPVKNYTNCSIFTPASCPYNNHPVSGESLGPAGHSSWAYDENGESVRVWDSGGDLKSMNLRTGELRRLISLNEKGSNINGHFARMSNSSKKGWALFGTYVDFSLNGSWNYNQIYMIELKNSYDKNGNYLPQNQRARVWRIGAKNSFWYYTGNGWQYFAQMFASIDMHGNNIYYGSNWFGTDNLELYQVELPKNWYEVLSGQLSSQPLNCDLTSASWSLSSVVAGAAADLNVQGSNCNGVQLNYTIYEYDPTAFLPDDIVTSFISNSLNPSWTAIYQADEDGSNPEYYFKAFVISNPSENIQSNTNNLLSVMQSLPLCTDADSDKWNATSSCNFNNIADCKDDNALINPGAIEICGNGIDEDCNGSDLICGTTQLFTLYRGVNIPPLGISNLVVQDVGLNALSDGCRYVHRGNFTTLGMPTYGYFNNTGAGEGDQSTIFYFDLNSILPGTKISKAYLSLYVTEYGGGNDPTPYIPIRRIQNPNNYLGIWYENTGIFDSGCNLATNQVGSSWYTWDSRPANDLLWTDSSTFVKIPYRTSNSGLTTNGSLATVLDDRVLGSFDFTNSGGKFINSTDLSEDIQKIVDGQIGNYGWYIDVTQPGFVRVDANGKPNYIFHRIAVSEYSDQTKRPRLFIETSDQLPSKSCKLNRAWWSTGLNLSQQQGVRMNVDEDYCEGKQFSYNIYEQDTGSDILIFTNVTSEYRPIWNVSYQSETDGQAEYYYTVSVVGDSGAGTITSSNILRVNQ